MNERSGACARVSDTPLLLLHSTGKSNEEGIVARMANLRRDPAHSLRGKRQIAACPFSLARSARPADRFIA